MVEFYADSDVTEGMEWTMYYRTTRLEAPLEGVIRGIRDHAQ